MRRAEELTGQQPAGATAFVAAREVVAQAEEEKVLDAVCVVVNARPRTMVGSRQAKEEAWACCRPSPSTSPQSDLRSGPSSGRTMMSSAEEEGSASDDIEALFGDTDDDMVLPAITDEQVTLLMSFETAHRKEVTRQFMAAEREALAAM
jgi:hypothetical protein